MHCSLRCHTAPACRNSRNVPVGSSVLAVKVAVMLDLQSNPLFQEDQLPIALWTVLWTVYALLVFTWRKMDQCLYDSAGGQSSSRSWEKVHCRVLPVNFWSVSLHLETTSNNPILQASTWGHSGNCWGCFAFIFYVLRLHFLKISVIIYNGTEDGTGRVALTLFLYFSVWRTACSWICLTKLRGFANAPWQRAFPGAGFHLHLCGFKEYFDDVVHCWARLQKDVNRCCTGVWKVQQLTTILNTWSITLMALNESLGQKYDGIISMILIHTGEVFSARMH